MFTQKNYMQSRKKWIFINTIISSNKIHRLVVQARVGLDLNGVCNTENPVRRRRRSRAEGLQVHHQREDGGRESTLSLPVLHRLRRPRRAGAPLNQAH